MRKVLVTGSEGFIGKNLIEALRRDKEVILKTYNVFDARASLDRHLEEADVIYHLAGVNRPEKPEEYDKVNWSLTREIIAYLESIGRCPSIVFSSSIQANHENPYGVSKRKAEEVLRGYAERNGTRVLIFRLPNVFGKWCRPNYNSVVATYCYNISKNIDITISDPDKELELVYIDDVIRAFLSPLADEVQGGGTGFEKVAPSYRITLGGLVNAIYQFRDIRHHLIVPDFSDRFIRCLYATYLSYLNGNDFAYNLDMKDDNRGRFAELLKSQHFGQIFVSRTNPGITRGNHYHDTKAEKFCVLEGEAIIRFRHILSNEVVIYRVSGEDFRVVDIPPGHTHSIENVGKTDMIVLFWASEPFDPAFPDTYTSEVLNE